MTSPKPIRKRRREPILIEFASPVSDDVYLGIASAVMGVLDLAGLSDPDLPLTMTIDQGLDDAYDEVDPFGPVRTQKGAATRRRGSRRPTGA